jgi:hypothetical protein
MGNGLEKRRFQRLECPLEVRVERLLAGEAPNEQPSWVMKSRNISREGICLETKSLELGGIDLLAGRPGARTNRLRMSIGLFPETPMFVAIGELCWYDVARDTTELIYQMGIIFIDIEGSGRKQLVRFLKNHKTPSIIDKLSNIKGYLRK